MRATFWASLLVMGAAACGGGDSGIPSFPVREPAVAADIYAAGYRYADHANPVMTPCTWKNGERTDLEGTEAVPLAIAVSDGVVYTAGYYEEASERRACYWVGATRHVLEPDLHSSAHDIRADGEVIKVLGRVKSGSSALTRLWTVAADGTVTHTDYSVDWAEDYVIAGNDVYVSGAIYDQAAHNWDAYYRKNDGEVQVCPGPWITAGQLFVDGQDVYVTGHTSDEYPTPFYWKNGERVDLPGIAQTGAIAVGNGNVYVFGVMKTVERNGVGLIWKNGIPYTLPGNGVSIGDMVVLGDDVYATGNHTGEHDTACYWVNGTLFDLDGTAAITLTVVPR